MFILLLIHGKERVRERRRIASCLPSRGMYIPSDGDQPGGNAPLLDCPCERQPGQRFEHYFKGEEESEVLSLIQVSLAPKWKDKLAHFMKENIITPY